MKKLYALLLVLPLALMANGRQLSPAEAITRIGGAAPRSISGFNLSKDITPALTVTAPGNPDFKSVYIFKNAKEGFVVVSADDCAMPLLGYSDTGNFDASAMPPQLRWWLDFYAAEINRASQVGASATMKAVARPTRAAIAPMIATQWNQDAPYNDDCPMDGSERSVTGCVATAMAQAMNYHQWPKTGTGSNSYLWNKTTLSVDFSKINYDWDNMTDTYDSSSTEAQKEAVAELMYSCGVSVNMEYSSSESAASSYDMGEALVKYFGYSTAMTMPERSFYGLIDWENLVYDQLENGMPVLYGGQSNQGGHQFVCDGYSSDGYFHFNWGWSGMSDGYFLLSALDPESQGIGGSTSGFNFDQSIVCNMQPAPTATIQAAPYICCYGDFGCEKTSATLGQTVEFQASEAFYNMACTPVEGQFGIKITGDDGSVSYIGDPYNYEMGVIEGYDYYEITLPSTLDAGSYTVTPVFKSNDGSTWADVLCPLSAVGAVKMTVTGNSVTFSDIKNVDISITDFTLNTPLYYNTNFSATFTVTNSGTAEYYGDLMLELVNNAGQPVLESYSPQPVDLQAGQSEEFNFVSYFTAISSSATITSGSYTLNVYDYMTGKTLYTYPQAVQFTASSPSAMLEVTEFSLADSVVTDPSNVRFVGTVECTQGYYADQLVIAVFAAGQTTTSLTAYTDYIFISSGQTSEFSTKLSIPGAEEGDTYEAIVYNQSQTALSQPLKFTIGATSDDNTGGDNNGGDNNGGDNNGGDNGGDDNNDDSGVNDVTADNISIVPTFDGLEVSSSSRITDVRIYSIDGIMVRQAKEAEVNSVEIETSSLAGGSYIIVATDAAGRSATLHFAR